MLSKDYRVPREIDKRDLVFDPRPPTARIAVDDLTRDIKEMPEAMVNDPFEYLTPGLGEFRKIKKRSPVDAIAGMVRELTYGEMVEFAGELWHLRDVGEFTEQNLPQILWDWAQWKKQ